MTDQEVLKKAIEKTVKNGWTNFNEITSVIRQKEYPYERAEKHVLDKCEKYIESKLYRIWIFDHDFAKAFWGEAHFGTPNNRQQYLGGPKWQYQLLQIVLEENPIQYLKQFLED